MVSVTTSTVMVAAIATLLFLAVGPRILGYQTSTMLAGSMSPLINPGDVVVTVPVPVKDLKVGDHHRPHSGGGPTGRDPRGALRFEVWPVPV
ncbi:hypothetical protein [Arthrobacter sp. 2MCAF14]|uniref:hypothetical protein n=1 Tax=Arthrobacter sp. 2MCAF14 TaxID=3232982 RepID=UPI003F8DDD59